MFEYDKIVEMVVNYPKLEHCYNLLDQNSALRNLISSCDNKRLEERILLLESENNKLKSDLAKVKSALTLACESVLSLNGEECSSE